MASFNSATRELVLKLVYYGPGLGGKTTTLKALLDAVRPEHRGKMISLATPVDRTLYFDFLPVRLPGVGDMQLRLQLFTVPGQVYFNATRKLVLTGADGITFVADSQAARFDANVESLDNLRENLNELNRPIENVPIVMCYNKRDLPDVVSIEELDRELNPHGFPSLATSASTGAGVFEALDALIRLVLDDLRGRRVIPADIQIPHGGMLATRLAEHRTGDVVPVPTRSVPPAAGSEHLRVVAADEPVITAPSSRGHTTAPQGSTAEKQTRPTAMPPPPNNQAGRTVNIPGAAPVPSLGVSPTGMGHPLPDVARSVSAAVSNAAHAVHNAVQNSPSLLSTAVGSHAGMVTRGASLTGLFDAEDHETVRTVEEALGEAILPRAVLLLEALLVRILERSAKNLGRADAPHEAIAWTLSVPAERYARLRAAAQRARRGGEITRRDALEAYVLVSMAQIAATSNAR